MNKKLLTKLTLALSLIMPFTWAAAWPTCNSKPATGTWSFASIGPTITRTHMTYMQRNGQLKTVKISNMGIFGTPLATDLPPPKKNTEIRVEIYSSIGFGYFVPDPTTITYICPDMNGWSRLACLLPNTGTPTPMCTFGPI